MNIFIIVLGIILIVTSGILTGYFYKKNDPVKYKMGIDPVPGSGQVPLWVSHINITGWIILIVGIIFTIINYFLN